MTPKAAYDHTAARARRLLRLHDGLINLRQRSIRDDWRTSFCRFMRWPLTSEIQRVDSKDALIILRPSAAVEPDDFTRESLDDLLRSALVFGVSALDRYVHERVIKRFVAALKATPLTRAQREFAIPAVMALQATDSVRRAAREGRQARPANEVRNRVQEVLHLRPFQSWRQVHEAFELIGISDLAGQLQTLGQAADIESVKRQLHEIVAKRHRIAHEGDLVRHERGGQPRASQIRRGFVEQSLDFLDQFVGKLELVG